MKLESEQVIAFDYNKLEELVKELYGQEIRILDMIPDELIGHYTYHKFDIHSEYGALDSVGDDEIVKVWTETGQLTGIDMDDVEGYDWLDTADVDIKHILHRLFTEGHIEAGKYLMLVDW